MNPLLRNILALLVGGIIGMGVNMGIIMLGPHIIANPEGYDPTTMEGIKEGIHLLQSKHFIMPWLAHGLGTLAGAFVTSKVAVSRHMMLSLLIGVFFLIGGIMMVRMVPAPTWFVLLDLIGAYIPMACLGHKLASNIF